MAFFAWSLLLPPFFTPATLFIYESTKVEETTALMPYPSIANTSEAHRFTWSPPTQRGTTQYLNDTRRTFTGPRTILGLLATATSSLGEIPPLDLPYNNSAYSVKFYAPIVRCEDANNTEQQRMDTFLREEMANTKDSRVETHNAYYSFVPTYNSTGDLDAVWHPRHQMASRPLNELWMTFLRPTINDHGKRIKPRHYQICRPHNASYHLNISQLNGFQQVSGNYSTGAAIPFPQDDPDQVSNMTQHAYTAFMLALSDQLVGKLACLDLDAYFELDEEMELYKGQNESQIFDLSDQRLRDKGLARNRTLDVLIEELSFNTSVALMHNRLLTSMINTTVKLTDNVNRYDYKPLGLFIPYALANMFAFVCIVLGVVSYIRDGVMPGKKVQDFVYAARSPEFHSHPSLGSRNPSLGAALGADGVMEMRVGAGDDGRARSWRSVRWSGDARRGEGGGGANV
ncbi:hypothetical protein BDW02DRAFT_594079 [Decorospora gaudefroyi]|uniref:Uncharacterized protein n=1 Tax=Decorospora gaudefroyi TaxID=184978 RepID=A0A6A5KWG0_9PLEO|nr:hypothetical protein BDW02DRAFT_594079 [Decorospora gaudefroyi]